MTVVCSRVDCAKVGKREIETMAGKAIHRLEELEIWKSAMRTAVKVCRLFQRFPDYVFGDLICRSAVSVP